MTSQTKWWWLDPAGCLCNSQQLCNSHQLCNSQQHQHQQHDLKDMTSQTKCWRCERQHHQCKCHFKYDCSEIDCIPRILGSKERHYETVHDPFRIDLLVLQKLSKGRINTLPPNLSLTVPDPTTPSISAANCCSPKLPPNCPQIISNHWIVQESSEASKD